MRIAYCVLKPPDCEHARTSAIRLMFSLRSFSVKPKSLFSPKPYIVAVETVRREAEVQKVLLERCRDGRLSGCGETSKPDGEALLLAGCVALCAREGWVPGDVA
jgi:hypothetical protein